MAVETLKACTEGEQSVTRFPSGLVTSDYCITAPRTSLEFQKSRDQNDIPEEVVHVDGRVG